MPKVFISYARDGSNGEKLATKIQQYLEASGLNVFRDVTDLEPGDPWFHILETELETSNVMVLVLSEKVRKSEWVYNEFSMAKELGIPVIPVLAEKMRYPLWIRSLQILDFCAQSGSNAQLLLESIKDKTQEKATLPSQSSAEERKPSWASKTGTDQHGNYADLTIKNIIQRFRWIEPGKFWMGSPLSELQREPWVTGSETQHQVTLTKGFWLADTSCTQAFWKAVYSNNPANFRSNRNNPVEQVSWNNIQEFIQILNKQIPNLNASLSTEAQWEYACRAGTETPFAFGENITPAQVNYDGKKPYAGGKQSLYRQKTVPVKSFPPNPWGLYEMHGNVWEWCQDMWQETLPIEPVTDPIATIGTSEIPGRVVRGGSWSGSGGNVRSATRSGGEPDVRDDDIGFRLAIIAC